MNDEIDLEMGIVPPQDDNCYEDPEATMYNPRASPMDDDDYPPDAAVVDMSGNDDDDDDDNEDPNEDVEIKEEDSQLEIPANSNRWYLCGKTDGTVEPQRRLLNPLVIYSRFPRKSFTFENVTDEPARYRVVLRLTISRMIQELKSLKCINISTTVRPENLRERLGDEGREVQYWVTEAAIDHISRDCETSVWLHTPVRLDKGLNLQMKIELGPGQVDKGQIELHHVEFVKCGPTPEIPGPEEYMLVCTHGTPRRPFLLFDTEFMNKSATAAQDPSAKPGGNTPSDPAAVSGDSNPGDPAVPPDDEPATPSRESPSNDPFVTKVHACKMSQSGEFLVTLSYLKTQYMIDLWNVSAATTQLCSKEIHPESLKISSRIASFQDSFDDRLFTMYRKTPVHLAISYSGTQIALLPDRRRQTCPEFLLFRADHTMANILRNTESEIDYNLVPYGDFHCSDYGSKGKDERFVACDGYSVTVFIPNEIGPWEQLFKIPLAPMRGPDKQSSDTSILNKSLTMAGQFLATIGLNAAVEETADADVPPPEEYPDFHAAFNLIMSLQRGFFAWRSHPRVLTIWSLETKKSVSHTVIKDIHNEQDVPVGFSFDASVMLVKCRKKYLATFWTQSGVLIHRYGEDQGLLSGHYLVKKGADNGAEASSQKGRFLKHIFDTSGDYRVRSLENIEGCISYSPEGRQILVKTEGPVVHVMDMKRAIAQNGDNACRFHREQDHKPLSEREIFWRPMRDTERRLELRRGDGSWVTFSSRFTDSGFRDKQIYEVNIIYNRDDPQRERKNTVLSFTYDLRYAFFAGAATRLVIVADNFIQMWSLPKMEKRLRGYCALLLCWSIKKRAGSTGIPGSVWEDPFRPLVCRHYGNHGRLLTLPLASGPIKLDLLRPIVFDREHPEEFLDGIEILLRMLVTLKNVFRGEEERKCEGLKHGIVNYLNAYINYYPLPDKPWLSVMSEVCRGWKSKYRIRDKELLYAIFGKKNWVPFPSYPMYSNSKNQLAFSNPISILLADKAANSIGTAKLLIRRCLEMAHETGQVGYLSVVLDALPKLLNKHEETALKYLRDLGLIRVSETTYLLNNHKVAYPPLWSIWPFFWNRLDKPVHEVERPVIQIHHAKFQPKSTVDDSDPEDVWIQFYVASYDALWIYYPLPDDHEGPLTKFLKLVKRIDPDGLQLSQFSATFEAIWNYVGPYLPLWFLGAFKGIKSTSEGIKSRVDPDDVWWSRIKGCCRHMNPYAHQYIRTHNFTHDCYDNPAIDALIKYKWNTLGFNYWLVRFLVQLCYYVLVIRIVFRQIYPYSDDRQYTSLRNLSVFTFIMSGAFLILEGIKLIRQRFSYFLSIFNWVDVATFMLPFIGSFNQLYMLGQGISTNDLNCVLGISVVFIYLHALFEMRVFESFCKLVITLTSPVSGVGSFLVVFFTGLLAFATAFLHNIYTSSGALANDTQIDSNSTDATATNSTGDEVFPKDFFKAFASTFIFLGGRFDPLADEFKESRVSFYLLVMLFLFCANIVMLNVMIALMAQSYEKAAKYWREACLENRLRYVASAENLSYRIQGYREQSDFFPKYIFFSPTHADTTSFRTKYSIPHPYKPNPNNNNNYYNSNQNQTQNHYGASASNVNQRSRISNGNTSNGGSFNSRPSPYANPNTGGFTRTNPGANPGAGLGANPGTNPGANPRANSGASPGANSGASPGANSGANSGASPGASSGANTGASLGVNTGGNGYRHGRSPSTSSPNNTTNGPWGSYSNAVSGTSGDANGSSSNGSPADRTEGGRRGTESSNISTFSTNIATVSGDTNTTFVSSNDGSIIHGGSGIINNNNGESSSQANSAILESEGEDDWKEVKPKGRSKSSKNAATK